jgi:hypothetical protein
MDNPRRLCTCTLVSLACRHGPWGCSNQLTRLSVCMHICLSIRLQNSLSYTQCMAAEYTALLLLVTVVVVPTRSLFCSCTTSPIPFFLPLFQSCFSLLHATFSPWLNSARLPIRNMQRYRITRPIDVRSFAAYKFNTRVMYA